MKVRWRPMAEADRDAIFDYIAQDNPKAALELDEDFTAKAATAGQRPKLYRAGRMRGTREIVVRANYLMIYRIDEDEDAITILRVLHAAQQWPPASDG